MFYAKSTKCDCGLFGELQMVWYICKRVWEFVLDVWGNNSYRKGQGPGLKSFSGIAK